MPPEEQKQPDNSSYDFILKAEEPPEESFLKRLNKKRLILFLILILVFITTVLIVMANIQARENEAQKNRLVEIAQMQTEISRLAAIGAEKAEDENNRLRAEAIQQSIDGSLEVTKDLLENRKTLTDEELLKAKQNTQTDEQLEKASDFKSFDKAFNKIIDSNMVEYQRALIAAEKAGNQDEITAFQTAYSEANAILGLVDDK